MPNYFDYISESADRYNEPEFIEESVNDSFNETIADMDLHCFQEGLGTVAAVLGAAALIGLLIVLVRKIIKSLGSSTKSAKEALDKAKKAGVEEIASSPSAPSHHDNGGNGGSSNSTPTSEESTRVIQSSYKIEVVDPNGANFKAAEGAIIKYFETANRFFQKYESLQPSEYNKGPVSFTKLYNDEDYNETLSGNSLKSLPKSVEGLLIHKPKWGIDELNAIFVSLEGHIKHFQRIESDLKETKVQLETSRNVNDMFMKERTKEFQANVAKISAFSTMIDTDLHITCKDIYDTVNANLGYGNATVVSGRHTLKGKTR